MSHLRPSLAVRIIIEVSTNLDIEELKRELQMRVPYITKIIIPEED